MQCEAPNESGKEIIRRDAKEILKHQFQDCKKWKKEKHGMKCRTGVDTKKVELKIY